MTALAVRQWLSALIAKQGTVRVERTLTEVAGHLHEGGPLRRTLLANRHRLVATTTSSRR